MSYQWIVVGCLGLLSITACNNSAPKRTTAKTQTEADSSADTITRLETKHAALFDVLTRELRGAALSDTLRNTRLLYFSNDTLQDSLILRAAPGPIVSSRSEMRIVTADGRAIYRQEFPTYFFARDLVEDHVPFSDGTNDAAAISDLAKRVQALQSVTRVQAVTESVTTVFDNLFTNKESLLEDAEGSDVCQTELFKKVTATDSKMKILFIPCFDCDEGGYYVVYAPNEGKAIELYATD